MIIWDQMVIRNYENQLWKAAIEQLGDKQWKFSKFLMSSNLKL